MKVFYPVGQFNHVFFSGPIGLEFLSWDQSGGCQFGKKCQFVYDSLEPICSVKEPMLSTFPMMQQIFPKSDCNSALSE